MCPYRPRAPHHRLIVKEMGPSAVFQQTIGKQIVITPEQHEQIQVWLDAADSGAYGAADGVYGAGHLIKALVAEVRELEARLADRTGSHTSPGNQSQAAMG
jgi:hypothetical protein